ncbi:MAG: acyl-CoA/acyl-ACP dehydrogenase [Proteobacteria bacterium]|nr:acyl-CoA/acyl-ACP dehydrogenase [Pseudomonadota bacterium]
MGYMELDLDLSKEAKAMQKEVRNFALEVMRPAGIEMDKLQNPAEAVAKNSPFWDVLKGYRKIGLHMAGLPKELGGLADELDPKIGPLMAEELGYGDAGLAISLSVSIMPFYLATLSPDPALQNMVKDYINDTEGDLIGCWAITEPEHGSDSLLGIDPNFDNPNCGFDLTAKLKGDEYILNGQKAAWVSNGTIATHAALHVGLDPTKGMQGSGLAIVPLDLPGVSRGKPLDKIGQRALNQGEIFFQEVKIPKSYMLIDDTATMPMVARMILTSANGHMGQTFVGLAQAAYDEALTYARQRVQGGVPIFEHKNVKLQLFNMFIKVEAARAFARRMAAYNRAAETGSTAHAIAAKILSTKTSFEVASEAISVFGGNGLAREYAVEKMFRDARAAMIEDGENNVLALAGSEDLI